MEEILCRKRQQLDQLRVAKETIQQRIVARQVSDPSRHQTPRHVRVRRIQFQSLSAAKHNVQ